MRLEVAGIDTYYGTAHILHGVSLDVQPGEAVALLGRNGAGKTTTLRSLTGLTRPRRGAVRLDGVEITNLRPDQILQRGMVLVPSGRRVFGELTVAQNLLLAASEARRRARTGGWTLARVFEVFPKLETMLQRRAAVLSGGEAQMLKLGRALLANPDLLLLDEPSEGLAPTNVQEIGRRLSGLKQAGLAMLICEQNLHFTLDIADRCYILEKGCIRFSAPASEIAGSEASRLYLSV